MSWDKMLENVKKLIAQEEMHLKRTSMATTLYIGKWNIIKPLLEMKSYIEMKISQNRSDAIKEGLQDFAEKNRHKNSQA